MKRLSTLFLENERPTKRLYLMTTKPTLFEPVIDHVDYTVNEEFVEICEICNKSVNADQLLLCSGLVNGKECPCGSHLYCLVPTVATIPSTEWYCLQCRQKTFNKINGHIGSEVPFVNMENGTSRIVTDINEFPIIAKEDKTTRFYPEQQLACPFLYIKHEDYDAEEPLLQAMDFCINKNERLTKVEPILIYGLSETPDDLQRCHEVLYSMSKNQTIPKEWKQKLQEKDISSIQEHYKTFENLILSQVEMITMSFNVHKSGDENSNYFQIWISNQHENLGKQSTSARQIKDNHYLSRMIVIRADLDGLIGTEPFERVLTDLLDTDPGKNPIYSKSLLDGRTTYESYNSSGRGICIKCGNSLRTIEILIHMHFYPTIQELATKLSSLFTGWSSAVETSKSIFSNLFYDAEVSFSQNDPMFSGIISQMGITQPPPFTWSSNMQGVKKHILPSLLQQIMTHSINCTAVIKLTWKQGHPPRKRSPSLTGELLVIKDEESKIKYRLEMETFEEWVVTDQGSDFLFSGDWTLV